MGRTSQTETLLTNGTVLVAGGGFGGTAASAELDQPATQTPTGLVSISLTPSAPAVQTGGAVAFAATGTFSDNSTQNLTSVEWSSSNSSVATVTNDPSNQGQAFGLTGGTTTVSACAGSICGSTTLTVNAGTPSITSVSPGFGTANESIMIRGSGFGNSAGQGTVSFNGVVATPASWSPTTITVPVPTGATTGNIVVNLNGQASNGANFIVGTLASIGVGPSNPTVLVESTLQLAATGVFSDGSSLDLTSMATWSSASTNTATVGGAGVVSGVYTGQAVIKAAIGSISGTVNLTVKSMFIPTGNLNTGRYSHTATLLDNGKVLIAGGLVNTTPVLPNNAELYDPAAGTFTVAAALVQPRYGHTATLLSNGLVLIAGGQGQQNVPIAAGELYDPVSGSFFATGSLSTARFGHTSTLLPNGKVLIAGGEGQTVLASAEIYDPSTGTFSSTGNLNFARFLHTVTLLNSGQVLVEDGDGPNNVPQTNAELYDPVSGTFSIISPSPGFGGANASALLNTGDVLIANGTDADLYSAASQEFRSLRTGSLGGGALTLLGNGQAFLSGGNSNNAEVYDPGSGTFSSLGGMNTPRSGHTSTRLASGAVLMVGGLDLNSNALASAEIYVPPVSTPSGLVSIAVTPGNVSLQVLTTQGFAATGTFSNQSPQSLASATWTSSNSSVMTVSNDAGDSGQVLALQPGVATLTACVVSICGSAAVTVTSPAPQITSLNPSSGTVGNIVTVSGSGFGPPESNSTITFNGAPAVPVAWYPNSIIVAVPANASTGNVVVTVGGVSSNGVPFTMPRVITGLSATTGVPGSSITISGSDFGASTGTVTFAGQVAVTTSWSNTSIVAVVPSTTSGNVVVSNAGIQSNGVPFTVGPVVYANERTLTIDHTKIPNTDQFNFPVLVSGAFGFLANFGNGGKVQNPNGWDIILSTDSAGTNKLDHEIESYDPVSGTINFWVRVPSLSHLADTVIYLQYGSPAVITSQENKAGVWDSNYQMVLHLGEGAAPYHDSTSNSYLSSGNGNPGNPVGDYPTQAQGKIGEGQSFGAGQGSNQQQGIVFSQNPTPNSAITIEAWVQTATAVRIAVQGNYELFSDFYELEAADGTFLSGNLTGTINDNNWHHLVIAAAGMNIAAYVDGVQNSSQQSGDAILATAAHPLALGSPTGVLDEFRISSSMRSSDWIAAEFNNQGSPATFYATGQENAPSISAVSPPVVEWGVPVTVTGSGFTSTQGSVTLNGQAVTVTSWSNTSISFVVPNGASSGPIVANVGGTPTNGVGITVLIPTITSLSASSGTAGQTILISGSNFDAAQGAGGVTFDGTSAPVVSWSANSITVRVPPGAMTGNVVVTASDGASSNGVPFTVSDSLAVEFFSPPNGPVGTTVTVIGGGFGASQGASTLDFDGVIAQVTSWSDNQIVAIVPPGATTGPVTVSPGGIRELTLRPELISIYADDNHSGDRLLGEHDVLQL